MRTQMVLGISVIYLAGSCSPAHAQGDEPLTLDSAVAVALQHNRQLRSSRLDVSRVSDRLAAARTQRLPQFSWYTLAAQRLTQINFNFDRGAFGNYAGIGPIPGENTEIRTGRKPALLMIARSRNLYRSSTRFRSGFANSKRSRRSPRKPNAPRNLRSSTRSNRVIYGIVQAQSALDAIEESIRLYRETRSHHGAVRTSAGCAQGGQPRHQGAPRQGRVRCACDSKPARNTKRAAYLLLGRDLRTPFRVVPTEAAKLTSAQLPDLQRIAIERRPEVKQAALRAKQAEYDQRMAKSDYIPSVSLSLNYLSPVNYGSLIPSNIAAAGVLFQWEPFDWGRKKHEVSEKSRVVEQAGLARRQTEDQIIIDVNMRYRKLQEARQLLAVAGLTRDLAQERLRVSNNRYKQEVALIKEVLQQQATLARSKQSDTARV